MTDVFIYLFFFLKKKSCYLFQLPAVPGSLWDWGLVLWPGIEPVSPSPVEERGSNHWTTREFPFLTDVFITRDRQADRGRRPCDNWIRNQSDAAPRQGCQRLPAAPRRQERGLGQILHRPCPPPSLSYSTSSAGWSPCSLRRLSPHASSHSCSIMRALTSPCPCASPHLPFSASFSSHFMSAWSKLMTFMLLCNWIVITICP